MGRGADGVSFNNEPFGGFSEVSYHARDVVLCKGVKNHAEDELARAAGESDPKRAKNASASRVYENQSAFFRLMKV